MGWIRLLLLLVLGFWIARIVRRMFSFRVGEGVKKESQKILLRCSRCGTLIPEDTVVMHLEKPYCGSSCQASEGDT